MWKRRSVLGLGLSAIAPFAAAARQPERRQDLIELSPGVWFVESPAGAPWNGLAVVGEQQAALIGAFDGDETRVLIPRLVQLASGRPVHFIATHARQGAGGGLAAAKQMNVSLHVHASLADQAAADTVVGEPVDLDLGGRRLRLFDPAPGRAPHSLVVYEAATGTLFGAGVIRGDRAETPSDPASLAVAVLNVAHAFPETVRVVPERGGPGGFDLLVASEQAASLAYLRQSLSALA